MKMYYVIGNTLKQWLLIFSPPRPT